MAPAPGLVGEARLVVTEAHTAEVVGSGDVPVLATPLVVALCEQATVAALRPHLEAGTTSVGVRVELEHLAPSVVGSAVVARARLVAVEGRKLRFEVSVTDGDRGVAEGTVARAVVDRARFLAAAGAG
jgi:predicted thioesterase